MRRKLILGCVASFGLMTLAGLLRDLAVVPGTADLLLGTGFIGFVVLGSFLLATIAEDL